MTSLYASFKIFLRRLIFALPLHSRFTDLIFPVALTAAGTSIIYWLTTNLLVTVGCSIVLLFIVLFYQNLLYRVFYTHGLNSFLLAVRHSHPVTQKFAASLLIRFFEDTHYASMSNALFLPTGPTNLKSLIHMLENNGVALAPELYAVLLTKAGELLPSELIATWDTNAVPLAVDQYRGYFTILRRVYDYMPTEKKIRIFIFTDEADFNCKTADPMWQAVLDYHRDSFGFSRLYYCYKTQFDGFRDGSPDADKNIHDFVFFKTSCLFVKYRWVIGREGNAGKTYMISDQRVVEATERFVLELVSELQVKNQFVEL